MTLLFTSTRSQLLKTKPLLSGKRPRLLKTKFILLPKKRIKLKNVKNKYIKNKSRELSMKSIKTLIFSIALLITYAFQLQAGQLHDLINADKTEEAIELLNSKTITINLEELDNDGYTALLCACVKNNTTLAWILIGKGANVNASPTTGPNTGATPLLCACIHNNFKLTETLIKKGASVNASLTTGPNAGSTPLLFACINGNFELAKLLIEKGANVNASLMTGPNAGGTPLLYACVNGNFDLTKLLVEKGANVKTSLTTGPNAHKTPLNFIFTIWKADDLINKIIPVKNDKIKDKESLFLQKASALIAKKYDPKRGLTQEIDLLPLKSLDVNGNSEELINICKEFIHHFFTIPHIALMPRKTLSRNEKKLSKNICEVTPFEWALKNRFKITKDNFIFLCRLLNFAKVASKKYLPKNNVDEDEKLFNDRYGKFNDLIILFEKNQSEENQSNVRFEEI